MPGQNTISYQQPKKPLISKKFIIIFCLILILPVGLGGAYVGQCKIRQNNARNSKQAEITAFKSAKLTSYDNNPTKVYLGGDCFDSGPYVQVDRQVSTTGTASDVLADMRLTLNKESYSLSNEVFYKYSCGYSYGATATGNSISFKVDFVTDTRVSTSDCFNGQPISEAELSNQPVQLLMARLN